MPAGLLRLLAAAHMAVPAILIPQRAREYYACMSSSVDLPVVFETRADARENADVDEGVYRVLVFVFERTD